MCNASKISGTFIDFSLKTNRFEPLGADESYWHRELKDMKDCGMDCIVIARIMDSGKTHYPSKHYEDYDGRDTPKMIIDAALENGLDLSVGLYLNLQFWDRKRSFSAMMRRDQEIYTRLFDELMELHGDSKAISSIYLTNEPDRDNIETPERASALKDFLAGIYAHVKSSCSLKVMTAPFFSKSLPPQDLAQWWDDFMDCPMFDILAMQDGVGCIREIVPDDVAAYYCELSPLFSKRNIEFWNDLETFVHTPIEGAFQTFAPAQFSRIDRQYEAAKPYVSKTLTWEFGHFLGRQQCGEARYNEFKKWNLGT